MSDRFTTWTDAIEADELALRWILDWLAMYHLFMSGVTYLGSLWQAHKQGWTIVPTLIDALLDIQGCSATMEGLAGQSIWMGASL